MLDVELEWSVLVRWPPSFKSLAAGCCAVARVSNGTDLFVQLLELGEELKPRFHPDKLVDLFVCQCLLVRIIVGSLIRHHDETAQLVPES